MIRNVKEQDIRILSIFFHPALNFTAVGGAEKRFIEILKVWSTERVDITIIDSNPGLIPFDHANCKVVEMSSTLHGSGRGAFSIYLEWLLWLMKACILCPRLARRRTYDVILAPNNTLPNLIVACLVHKISHAPLCVVVHHMDFPYVDTPADFASTYGIYRKARFSVPVAFVKAATFFVVLALLKHSDLCIAVSNYTAKFLLKNGVSQNRIRISGNGVDTDMIERFRASRKLYEGVFVGRIARDKGVFDLVEVWKRIATDRPEAKLLIIGTGPDSSKLKECAETANMTSNIILKGWCKDAELYSLMKTSELFLFPSRFEGWGLAVGEALACGLPVVCYDIPALREIFGKCGSVFFVPTGDTDRFTETSERILHNGDFSRLGAISKEYAKYFSWRKVALNDLAMIRTHVQSEFAEDQFKKVDQQ